MKIITKNSEQTKKLGEDFAKTVNPGETILLFGDLGAGKTTFVQGFAQGLGIKDRILSPTFVLQRIHEVKDSSIKNLNHIDLYRIDDPVGLESLGLVELFDDPSSITLIEWAERLSNFSPKKGRRIHLKHISENEREIEIEEI